MWYEEIMGAFHLLKISGISGSAVNGTTFYQSEIPLLLPPKFPEFFRKWKAPDVYKQKILSLGARIRRVALIHQHH